MYPPKKIARTDRDVDIGSLATMPDDIINTILQQLTMCAKLRLREVCKRLDAQVRWATSALKLNCRKSRGSLTIFAAFHDLRELTLVHADERVAAELNKHCTRLESLLLERVEHSFDMHVSQSGSRLQSLRALKFSNCHNSTNDGLVGISGGSTALTTLSVVRCTGLTDNGFVKVVHNSPKLEFFRIDADTNSEEQSELEFEEDEAQYQQRHLHELTDATLTALSQNCPNLRSLRMTGCPLVTDRGLHAIAAGCTNLTELNMTEGRMLESDSLVYAPQGGHDGQPLNISFRGVLAVAETCKLESLGVEIEFCTEDLNVLAPHLASLRYFVHTSGTFNLQAFAFMTTHCRLLTNLVLSYSDAICDNGLKALAENCPNLRLLRMLDEVPMITNTGILNLAHGCQQLEILILLNLHSITDAGWLACALLPRLQTLAISSPLRTDIATRLLVACKDLRTLLAGVPSDLDVDTLLQIRPDLILRVMTGHNVDM